MGFVTVSGAASSVHAGHRARTRALIVPREHGAWGLLLVPLFSGVAVGAASGERIWALVLFTVAALALFWLRTPVESLLGTTPLSAQTREERRTTWIAAGALGTVAAVCLTALLWSGRNPELLLFGCVAGVAFIIQTSLMKFGRRFRMAAQLVGAFGLTCTSAAGYYIATGLLDGRAGWLWAANWMFAANQIHFVQLSLHTGRVSGFNQRCERGQWFFLGQMLLLMGLISGSYLRVTPGLAVVAFVPILARGFYWFFKSPQPLRVRSLGWSEMAQGILFGVLLTVISIFS